LNPHALLFNEGPPFDGGDPDTQMAAPSACQNIDYSCYISGNPDAKLVSPATVHHPDAPPPGGCGFSLNSSTDIADHTSPSSVFDWNFDMLTLGSGLTADNSTMYV